MPEKKISLAKAGPTKEQIAVAKAYTKYKDRLCFERYGKPYNEIAERDKLEFDQVRWMEISSYLREKSANGTKPVTSIEFEGERLDMTSVHRWRRRILAQPSG